MRKIIACAVLVIVLASCIGQKEWTVDEWREHLSFATPPLGLDASTMIPGFRNIEGLPKGTHIVYDVDAVGVLQGTDVTVDMTIGFTVAGTDIVDGINCTALDVDIEMDMNFMGESLIMSIKGKEWIDENGAPVKVEEETVMEFGEFKIPVSIKVNQAGEEIYNEHDCWVMSGTQSLEIMGITAGGEITEYVDKKSYSIVRAITKIGDEEADTGYIEPPISVLDQVWELGNRETVTTDSGTYDCQVIYLKQDGQTMGTIWASEDVRAPIQYVYSYETTDTTLEMTMTLVEYTAGV